MKLRVENFGPIKKAEVTLGPMTVFVGHSNTGKSYMAILIYSIMKVLIERASDRFLHYRDVSAFDEKILKAASQKTKWYNNKRDVSRVADNFFRFWVEFVRYDWKSQILHCFGEEGKSMLGGADRLAIAISDVQGHLAFTLHAHAANQKSLHGQAKLSPQYKKQLFASLQKDGMGYPHLKQSMQSHAELLESAKRLAGKPDEFQELLERENYQALASFLTVLGSQWLTMLMQTTAEKYIEQIQAYYLPAVRGGIMQSHRTLVSALIQRAPRAGLSAMTSIPSFNGVLSDFMDQLIHVRGEKPLRSMYVRTPAGYFRRVRPATRKEITKIGADVEEKIMQGKIDVKKSDVDYPDFLYTFKSGGKKHGLPLMSVSSMVSELAPVSLFIHRYVNSGDLFIVEEPEAHLHPAAQRLIAGILVRLVNAGVRVLITTHSDTMLEQLGNFAHAAEIGKKVQGQSLGEKEIRAYSFASPKTGKQKKTVVKVIPFDKDSGYLSADHLDASSNLYNEGVDLFNAGPKTAKGASGKKDGN